MVMRIPLASYGRRELLIYGVPLLALATASVVLGFVWLAAAFAVLLVFLVSFFRDPTRAVPDGEKLLVAPADGRVTHVEECTDDTLGCAVTRVSIFLSILNVHVNRAPCAGRVETVTYREGMYLNAMRAESAHRNESNTIVLEAVEAPGLRVLVKQISGAIARRIVCTCAAGTELARGERVGMIKFGSRTDLCVPADGLAEVRVKVGDHVCGGKTVIGVLK